MKEEGVDWDTGLKTCEKCDHFYDPVHEEHECRVTDRFWAAHGTGYHVYQAGDVWEVEATWLGGKAGQVWSKPTYEAALDSAYEHEKGVIAAEEAFIGDGGPE